MRLRVEDSTTDTGRCSSTVALGDDAPGSAAWSYQPSANDGGDLEHEALIDLYGDASTLERMEMKSRWSASGAGGADAVGGGGDLESAALPSGGGRILRGDATLRLTQCWDEDGALTAQDAWVEIAGAVMRWDEPVGDVAADCPFPDAAEVSRLP